MTVTRSAHACEKHPVCYGELRSHKGPRQRVSSWISIWHLPASPSVCVNTQANKEFAWGLLGLYSSPRTFLFYFGGLYEDAGDW